MSDNHQHMPPALREALNEQPAHARQQLEQVWDMLGGAEEPVRNVPDDDEAWEGLQHRMGIQRLRRSSYHRRVRREPRRWAVGIGVGVGVSVAAMLLLLGLLWWRQPVAVLAAPGEQITHTLPDGSTVRLNSATEVSYTRAFQALPFMAARQRSVWVEGEAFFEVVDEGRPFVIETFNAQVSVLGTAFNVRARQLPLDRETRVTLVRGQVLVSAKRNTAVQIRLTESGQEVRIAVTAVEQPHDPVQLEQLKQVLAWQAHGFAVVDRPVAMILAEVERRYALEIEAEEGIALMDSMSLFYLRGTTPEKILHDICLSQACQYRRTSTGFVLFPTSPE